MKKFEDLTQNELWSLRNEIVLNSHFIADYENSFGFSAKSICDFFDGYMDYIWELAKEQIDEPTNEQVFDYDTSENLLLWFNCFDDLSWVEYEEND